MHVAFNQDASCCVVGTTHGFQVYNCSPFGRFYSSEDVVGVRGVGLAQMLYSTSLVVTVGNGEYESPRRLSIINTRRSAQFAILCELTFPTAVRAVRLNRQRLVVVLDAQIYIYNIANMKLLHTLDTVVNRNGVADVTPTAGVTKKPEAAITASSDTGPELGSELGPELGSESGSNTHSHSSNVHSGTVPSPATGNWLVYPAGPPLKHHVAPPSTAGEAPRAPQGDVVVFDLDTLSPVTVVRAHRSPVAVLALNEDGTLLATTSDRGTLVRVFSIPSGTLLYEFRRGSYHSHVYSLAFSLGSKLLCVSSSTQTVHIYKLDAAHRVKQKPRPETSEFKLSDEGDTYQAPDDSGMMEDDAGYEEHDHDHDHDTETNPQNHSDHDDDPDTPPPRASPSAEASQTSDNKHSKPKSKPKSKSSWFSRSAWTDAARAHRSGPRMRDFAWFKLPLKQNTRTVLGLAPLSNLVYVATEGGKLFHYAIDSENGGECKKVAEFNME